VVSDRIAGELAAIVVGKGRGHVKVRAVQAGESEVDYERVVV
jgi:hypothetical protein